MANIKCRDRSRQLRKQGLSIGDIAKQTHTSKSTVSYWCRDIVLSATQVKKLAEKSKRAGTHQFLLMGERKRKARLKRNAVQKSVGAKDVARMTKQNLFFLGLGLYWGEGYKYGNDELGFTNSDEKMLLVFIHWLEKIYMIPKQDLILRVSINEIHKERIVKIMNYWSSLTKIPLSQFTKPTFIKTASKKRYENHNDYYGILRIKVRGGSALKQRILGSLDSLQ